VRWRVRKDAAPASSASLRETAAAARLQIQEMEAERDEIGAALPELTGDPRFAEAHDRLAMIDATLPVRRRALAMIEAEIPVAEKREDRERVAKAIAAQRTASDRLAARFGREYPEIAARVVDLFSALEDDAAAWRRLAGEAREHGLSGGATAEEVARNGAWKGAHGTYVRVADALIPALGAGTLWGELR